MFDADGWILSALGEGQAMPASREPMRKAEAYNGWIAWREMSQKRLRASGETLGIQHNLRMTLSLPEEADHQAVSRQVQEALQGAKGCLYARYGGDQWNQEIGRRECTLYLGVLEVM